MSFQFISRYPLTKQNTGQGLEGGPSGMYYHNGHPVGSRACFSTCNFGIFILMSERLICAIYISDESSVLLLWWDDLMNWGYEMTLWIRSLLSCLLDKCVFLWVKDDAQLDLMNDTTCIIHYLLLTRSTLLWVRRDNLKVTGREEFIPFSLDNEHQSLKK